MKSAPLVALLAATALARPSLKKRFSIKSIDDSTVGTSAVNILTYALVLEHLEDNFYRQGLANFTAAQFATAGFDATFYHNLEAVAADEAAHVAFLTAALTAIDAPAPAACTYHFPYSDVTSFLTLATILEGVGVSAYLGAAADIADPDYLTAAGSILTIEARHASYLRGQIKRAPFPSAYDTPLDYNQVYSLAAPFIVACPPTNPALGVSAFPRLAVAASGSGSGDIHPSSTITLVTPGYVVAPRGGPAQPLFAAFMTPQGPVTAPATPVQGGYSVVVPAGSAGQTYVVLTNCPDKVTDETTIAGPALLEVVVV